MTSYDSLEQAIPATASKPPTHPVPAYLAANQLGISKQVVLLYLPEGDNPAQEIIMANPTIDSESFVPNEKPVYRINTLFADQLRFNHDLYATRVCVTYTNIYGNQKVKMLDGLAAIAAQMGIDFIHGKTPLDRVSADELLVY